MGNKSNIAIYLREGEGGNPVKEESSIPLDQQHPLPLEQVPRVRRQQQKEMKFGQEIVNL